MGIGTSSRVVPGDGDASGAPDRAPEAGACGCMPRRSEGGAEYKQGPWDVQISRGGFGFVGQPPPDMLKSRSHHLALAYWYLVPVAGVGLAVFDVYSDLLVAVEYLREGHKVWGGLSLAFSGLNWLFGMLFLLAAVFTEDGMGWAAKAFLGVCGLLGVPAVAATFVNIDEDYIGGTGYWRAGILAVEAALESFPQTVLQSYVFLRLVARSDVSWVQASRESNTALLMVSLAVSAAVMCKTVATAGRMLNVDGEDKSVLSMGALLGEGSLARKVVAVAVIAALTCVEVVGKLFAACAFAAVFRGYALLALVPHAVAVGAVMRLTVDGASNMIFVSLLEFAPMFFAPVSNVTKAYRTGSKGRRTAAAVVATGASVVTLAAMAALVARCGDVLPEERAGESYFCTDGGRDLYLAVCGAAAAGHLATLALYVSGLGDDGEWQGMPGWWWGRM